MKAVEERRGRRYKEGGQMVQRGGFLGDFGESSRKNFFTEEQRKEGDGAEMEENWRRGLTPGDELHSEKQGSCYRVYRHVGSGARKPVSFLGPAGSLVGRVDHSNWHQVSERFI